MRARMDLEPVVSHAAAKSIMRNVHAKTVMKEPAVAPDIATQLMVERLGLVPMALSC